MEKVSKEIKYTCTWCGYKGSLLIAITSIGENVLHWMPCPKCGKNHLHEDT